MVDFILKSKKKKTVQNLHFFQFIKLSPDVDVFLIQKFYSFWTKSTIQLYTNYTDNKFMKLLKA